MLLGNLLMVSVVSTGIKNFSIDCIENFSESNFSHIHVGNKVRWARTLGFSNARNSLTRCSVVMMIKFYTRQTFLCLDASFGNFRTEFFFKRIDCIELWTRCLNNQSTRIGIQQSFLLIVSLAIYGQLVTGLLQDSHIDVRNKYHTNF